MKLVTSPVQSVLYNFVGLIWNGKILQRKSYSFDATQNQYKNSMERKMEIERERVVFNDSHNFQIGNYNFKSQS